MPASVKSQASTKLAGGVPFISDSQLKTALAEAHVPPDAAQAIVGENETARIDGLRSSLSVLALVALILAASEIDAWSVVVNPRLSAREVDLIREHIRTHLPPAAVRYDLTPEGIVVWPDDDPKHTVTYSLRDATGGLKPRVAADAPAGNWPAARPVG